VYHSRLNSAMGVPLDWLSPNTSMVMDAFQTLTHSNLNCIDWLVAADVVWVMQLIDPLVHTITTLNTGQPDGCQSLRMLLAHQTRSLISDRALWSSLQREGWHVHRLDTNNIHEHSYTSSSIDIFLIQR
jgi:hypothetical protein